MNPDSTAPEKSPAGPELIVETVGHVRVLTINRPHRMNALSVSLQGALSEAFLDARAEQDIRVIVLTATGDRAFSAGADLKELDQRDETARPFDAPIHSSQRLVFDVMAGVYKPVIVALNGVAIGGGFELALAADIRIAAEGVELGLPEAKIGMGAIYATVVLPRLIPLGVALERMFTGDFFTAEEALRWGLINRIVPRDRLLEESMVLAQRIAANAPLTVRRMKELAMKGLTLPVESALRLDVGPNPYTAEDRKEGIRAFLEKRKPVWKGR